MNNIPEFDENGNLPPNKDYWWATLAEVEERYAYTKHRKMLFEYLLKLAAILKRGGAKTLYLDGSFITIKEKPKDYDCCFDRKEVSNEVKLEIFSTPGDAQYMKYFTSTNFMADIYFTDDQCDFNYELKKPITYLDYIQQDSRNLVLKGVIAIDLTKENL